MAKIKNILNWLKWLAFSKPNPEQSIMERLEDLIPDLGKIKASYKVDTSIAEAGREALLAVDKLLKETEKALTKAMARQQQAIDVSDLQIEQQIITSDIIDVQYYKSLDAETIIKNLREWMFGDEKTISWFLENVLIPAFTTAFSQQTEARQRKLFNGLRMAVNVLQKLDGILLEPE
jgi:hypothetical protein